VLSSAVVLFHLTGPDLRELIIRCVNFGRDTDCRVYPATAWAACITGIEGVPEEWVKTVDDQLKTDPYTVSRRSLRESSDGLYRALLNNLESLKQQVESVESQK
jgi:ADP-ribosylglycohydrolase